MARKNGYALILAVLVMAITLAASLALAGIVAKGLRLSKEVDDSVLAFYASESAVEESLNRISQGLTPCVSVASPPVDTLTFSSSNNASFSRTCLVDGTDNLIQSTGRFHDASVALQVRIPQ
jgi:Tfp pilus assembly protein PilX